MIFGIVVGVLLALMFGRVLLPALTAVAFVIGIPIYFSFRFVCAFIWALVTQNRRHNAMPIEAQKTTNPETLPDNVINFSREKEKRVK